MPILSNADLKMVTDSYHGEGYKQGRQDERAKWLPLWEAVKKLDYCLSFEVPYTDESQEDPDLVAAEKDMAKVYRDLLNQGEK